MIEMIHPDLPDVRVSVTTRAFVHWSVRGWRRADSPTETAPGFSQSTPYYDEEE